jgi:hypothetical protein
VGRPISELLNIYKQQSHLSLSTCISLSDRVVVSKFNGLSLSEYCKARQRYCDLHHSLYYCRECTCMIKTVAFILKSNVCSLQTVFKHAFPDVTYHTLHAKRRVLQILVVAIKLQCQCPGNKSEVAVTELIGGIEYLQMYHFIETLAFRRCLTTLSLHCLGLISIKFSL